jgi:hypothetical protein
MLQTDSGASFSTAGNVRRKATIAITSSSESSRYMAKDIG